MAYSKKYNSKGKADGNKVPLGERAVQKFTQMIIDRMQAMKDSKWQKGWVSGVGNGMPQNLAGRNYSGTNSFFLQLQTADNGYRMPVFLTFKQAMDEGLRIKKGSESMPVVYWDLNIKDENGKRLTEKEYRNLSSADQKKCDVHPFLRAYLVFNVDQTNMEEVKKEKYDKLLAKFHVDEISDAVGMYENPALDRMVSRDEWLCHIQADKISSSAYYSPLEDKVVVPKKAQFRIGKEKEEIYKDGMEYYSSLLHEIAHSTGSKDRLNRTGGRFGDPKYAKEELVAELTAAMVGNAMGFDKRILNNNAAYLDSWIKVLKEDPKFIVSVMADVNKASKMIIEEVDKQKLELGEKPLLTKNDSEYEKEQEAVMQKSPAKSDKIKFDQAFLIKQDDGNYAVRATFKGYNLGDKSVDKQQAEEYISLPLGKMKEERLNELAKSAFQEEIKDVQEIRRNLPSSLGTVNASVNKGIDGNYYLYTILGDMIGGHDMGKVTLDIKQGYQYMKMPEGLHKMSVLSSIVRSSYGDQLEFQRVRQKEERYLHQHSSGIKM